MAPNRSPQGDAPRAPWYRLRTAGQQGLLSPPGGAPAGADGVCSWGSASVRLLGHPHGRVLLKVHEFYCTPDIFKLPFVSLDAAVRFVLRRKFYFYKFSRSF